MQKGKKVPVTIEFTSAHGRASLHLAWSWPGQSPTIVPSAALSHLDPPKLRPLELMTYRASRWMDFNINADCTAGTYTLMINGRKVLSNAKFAEPSSMVYALSLRTGEFRGSPSGRADQDMPNTEDPLPAVSYRVDDVRISSR